MKKLWIILLLHSFTAYSQDIWVGGRFGYSPPTTNSYVTQKPTVMIGGRALISFKRVEVGLDFESGRYRCKGIITRLDRFPGDDLTYSLYTAASYNRMTITVNYKMHINKPVIFYTGLGYGVDLGSRALTIISNHPIFPIQKGNSSDGGLALGLHTGIRYALNKTFDLQTEIAARTALIKAGAIKYMPVYFPVSLGVNARLQKFKRPVKETVK